TLMTDTEYRVAAGIMPVVSAALLISGVQWWYTSGSTFMKRTGQQAISVLVGVVVNVGLNLLLVGRFGYEIAAWTTLVASAAAAWAMRGLSRPVFRWRVPVAGVARSLGAAGVMAAAMFGLQAVVGPNAALQLAL